MFRLTGWWETRHMISVLHEVFLNPFISTWQQAQFLLRKSDSKHYGVPIFQFSSPFTTGTLTWVAALGQHAAGWVWAAWFGKMSGFKIKAKTESNGGCQKQSNHAKVQQGSLQRSETLQGRMHIAERIVDASRKIATRTYSSDEWRLHVLSYLRDV